MLVRPQMHAETRIGPIGEGVLKMCGRFTLRTNPSLYAEFLAVVRGFNEDWKPSYNVAPTQAVLCVRDSDQREFFRPSWGLIPSWAKDQKIASHCINARVETVAEKPSFRAAFKRRRCLVIADGLFEWRQPDKQPFYYTLQSGQPMLLAGLWESWQSPAGPLETCTICVTAANDFLGVLHDRMPIILPRHAIDHWLDPQVVDPEEVQPLLQPYPSADMQAWAVSKKVNSVRNNDPSLIEPSNEQQTLAF